MSILGVRNYGDDILRQTCERIDRVTDPEIQKLIKDMFDSMYAENGVGLAAPQVGVDKQMFILDVSREDQTKQPMVFINPNVVKVEGAIISYEGCLSFPEVFLDIKRYGRIVIKAQDARGRLITTDSNSSEGSLLARAMQHEFDHLKGILFIDQAVDVNLANQILNDHGFKPVEMDKQLDTSILDKELAQEIKRYKKAGSQAGG